MKQCPCGKYYLDRDTVCPFCGYKMTRAEWKEHLKELKAQRKEQQRLDKEKRKQPKTPEQIENERRSREACKRCANERKAADKRVVSAILISTENKKSAVGTAGRAVVGGALLGPVGAMAGALSGGSKASKATFSVKYASGRVATETVLVNSARFKELSALLHK